MLASSSSVAVDLVERGDDPDANNALEIRERDLLQLEIYGATRRRDDGDLEPVLARVDRGLGHTAFGAHASEQDSLDPEIFEDER